MGTATVDGMSARMFEERLKKTVPTDDICVAITSNVDKLHEAQVEAVVKTIASSRPEIIQKYVRLLVYYK